MIEKVLVECESIDTLPALGDVWWSGLTSVEVRSKDDQANVTSLKLWAKACHLG
jgi:hypothetical protein